jgi:hypothetical protein
VWVECAVAGNRLFLTSEYQADFSIVAAWRHPPICRLLVIKTAALISQKPPSKAYNLL